MQILKGVRNGLYYGGKVRFMHSLVMSILFMKGSPLERLRNILKLTIEHGIRIGVYVGVYKTVVLLLAKLEGRKSRLHCFLAGCLGALVINLDGDSPVNQQITLYIISRVTLSGGRLLQNKQVLPKFDFYKVLTTCSWAAIMFLYAYNKNELQPSMTSSMDFLYLKSDGYTDWTDYLPVYLPSLFKRQIEAFVAPNSNQ